MTIVFQIRYRAQFGEAICITGEASDIIRWDEPHPLMLQCLGEDFWTAEIELSDFADTLQYRYALIKKDGSFLYESGAERCISVNAASQKYTLKDFWRAPSFERVFHSTAFTQSIFKRESVVGANDSSVQKVSFDFVGTNKNTLIFSISMPQVTPKQGIAIVGNIPELGQWDMEKRINMDDSDFPLWEKAVSIEPSDTTTEIEYKYILYDLSTQEVIDYEGGENRRISYHSEDGLLICSDICFRKTQPNWRGAGVSIPVFSLRSEDSFGIGEFLDLKKMIDWAVLTGQRIIQTLPVNDTTIHHHWRDSYPYNSVSVFALNPNYLNIEHIAAFPSEALRKKYKKKQAEMNAKPIVDYQVVADEKMIYFKYLYKQEKDNVFASKAYRLFFEKNREWLVPYAVFCYLRDRFGTAYFHSWKQYSVYRQQDVLTLSDPQAEDYDQVAFHYFLQYHLDKQLGEVKAYAHQQGIALKGDVPIGISSDSVDAWTHPELFHLNTQTGAPPDDFSISGQNWGFPTYDWERMAKDHYQWWSRRFCKMADYFDAYRIDHILGFFRIWEIPHQDVWGLCGRFYPALPYRLSELRETGIDLDENRLLKPYIRSAFLPEFFGEATEYAKNTFLESDDNDYFHFKPAFDSQRKIEDFFQNNHLTDQPHQQIKKGLFLLHCEVLFLRDLHDNRLLHPRISFHQTHSYKDLDEATQKILSTLHDDFFYRRHHDFWKQSALRKLPTLIASTDMLVCGEDLGMVPSSVPEVMNALSILSLEVQRMPKAAFAEFSRPEEAPYLSVCTTSTHDTNPLRAWWLENRDKTQRYYEQILHQQGEAPKQCTPAIVHQIILQHLLSPALWVILPWQDWMALNSELSHPDVHAERINVPDNPDNFWCYRMHLSLEDLLQKEAFNQSLRNLISTAGR